MSASLKPPLEFVDLHDNPIRVMGHIKIGYEYRLNSNPNVKKVTDFMWVKVMHPSKPDTTYVVDDPEQMERVVKWLNEA